MSFLPSFLPSFLSSFLPFFLSFFLSVHFLQCAHLRFRRLLVCGVPMARNASIDSKWGTYDTFADNKTCVGFSNFNQERNVGRNVGDYCTIRLDMVNGTITYITKHGERNADVSLSLNATAMTTELKKEKKQTTKKKQKQQRKPKNEK